MTNEVVNKSNNLITSHFNFSMTEYRILLYAISLVNPLDKEFPREFKINVSGFAKKFNIDVNGLYKELRQTVRRQLAMRWMSIKTDDGWTRNFGVIEYFDYHDNEGLIEIRFSERMMPLLCNFKDCYTSYHLEQIALFKSVYSIRFYEFAIMHMKANDGKPTQFFITIDELKRRFEISDKYKMYNNLKRRVLEKSMTEINAFSNISLRYVEIKKGRSVDQIKLIVKYKNWGEAEHQHPINFDPELKL
jgi:plasmid replication initiation protein